MSNPERESVVKATIRNKIVIVHAVAEERDAPGYSELKYIGFGQYNSINDKPSTDKKFYHFWKR